MRSFSRQTVFFTVATIVLLAGFHASAVARDSRAEYRRVTALRETFSGKVAGETVVPRWLEDGERFYFRWQTPDREACFVLVDARDGQRRQLTESELKQEVTQTVAGEPLPCLREKQPSSRTGERTEIVFENTLATEVALYWSNDQGKEISYGTIPAGGQRELSTFDGHVWVIYDTDMDVRSIFRAEALPRRAVIPTAPATPTGEGRHLRRQRENHSPDGKFHAFIRDHNVFIRDTNRNEETQLTHDGTPDDRYEPVFHWSPDSRKLVVYKTLQGEDRQIHFVESSPKDRLQPKLHTRAYSKPGDRIPMTKPHLFHVRDVREIAVPDTLFPTPWSITRGQWDADSSRFRFLYNQRGHQLLRYLAIDADSGAVSVIIDEPCETFFDYTNKLFLHPLPETGEAIWMSQRDGWNHLYLYDTADGAVKNQITRGPWVVRRVEKVDAENRVIWFFAGGIHPGQDPYYLHYCRVDFDGQNLRVLTDGDGTHRVQHSPDRKYFIDTYSRVDMPPVHELRETDTGRLVCELGRADHSRLLAEGWRAPERFTAKGRDGETDIYGVIVRPTNFDPAKTYPVIEDIYAGPHGAFVPKGFQPHYAMQTLAELGFIVVKIDGMGTNYRSKAFHDVCWKNLADAGFPDRVRWIKAAAEKYPAMDITRVGIYGGSAGGQNAAGALLTHGDFYKVAVADCGCHDNRMDKIWWNEQWMGWPAGPHYAEQSNVTLAHRLTGKLMLVVGEVDDNVDPASTMQVAKALIDADKDFEMLVMPGVGHGAAGHPYAQRRMFDFFVRHLLEEP